MISGKFIADFDDFNSAVKSAETKLVGFETGASKVTSSLERMETSLSGRKLIQDATLAVQAVENIGGVSKLTEGELQRLAAQASAAAAKMKAMGIDVPPGIQAIADEAKAADTAHGSLLSTVKQVALGFAAMFTVRAAFNFVKDIVDDASAMVDLSTQTHISIEDLQLLAGGMSEFGVDADELGKGLFKLSRGIAGGDESVAHGLHLMGMSLKDVEGLNGKDLFLKIEGGLATLQGGLRDTAAADLFGGKLGAAMAGASEGIEGALDTWQRLNTVASTDSVKAMDTFSESIARAEKNLSSIAANMIGPVAEGFNTVIDTINKGATKWQVFGALSKDFFFQTTDAMSALIDKQNQQAEAAGKAAAAGVEGHGKVKAAIDTRTTAEQFMAALEADGAKALTEAQLVNLAHLKDIGALNAKNAEGIGVHAGQFAKYSADQAAALKVVEKATQDAAKAQSEWAGIDKLFFTQSLKNFKDLETEQARVLKLRNQSVVDGNAQIMALDAQLHDFEMKSSMDTATYQIMKIWEKAEAEIKAFKGTEQQMATHADLVRTMASYEAKGITDVMTTAVDTMAHKATSALDEVAAKATAAVASAQYSMVGGTQLDAAGFDAYYKTPAGIAEIIRNGGKRYYAGGGPPREFGGPVSAGSPYMVGERGPELFVPSGNGSILPNGAGGGVTVNATIYVNGTAEDVARQVAAQIMRQVKTGQQLGAA